MEAPNATLASKVEARDAGTLLALEAVCTCLIEAGVMDGTHLIALLDQRIAMTQQAGLHPEMRIPLAKLRERVSGVG